MKLIQKFCFDGCADAAIRYYQEVFGCTVRCLLRYRDAVANGWEPPCPGRDDAVYHSEVLFGDTEIRVADIPGEETELTRRTEHPVGLDTAEEVERIFRLLADGGEVLLPLQSPPYMVRIGRVRDRFGVLWTLMCDN